MSLRRLKKPTKSSPDSSLVTRRTFLALRTRPPQKLEAEAAGLDEKIRALEALNTANDDVEDVTPAAPKVKPVMMKLFPEYNLILQEIHRTHPTATNTHIGGYIKIKRNLPTTTEKLPNSSLTRDASTMLLTPCKPTTQAGHQRPSGHHRARRN
ncbi:hypothetical protein TNCV_2496491 [Trichonephila clavipes]|nr:hypothetical protein TNCV_2496491 [Trichonephila clavipes]